MGLLTTSFAMATSLKWAIVCYGVEVTNLVSTFDFVGGATMVVEAEESCRQIGCLWWIRLGL